MPPDVVHFPTLGGILSFARFTGSVQGIEGHCIIYVVHQLIL